MLVISIPPLVEVIHKKLMLFLMIVDKLGNHSPRDIKSLILLMTYFFTPPIMTILLIITIVKDFQQAPHHGLV
jgi:hypothetical protein